VYRSKDKLALTTKPCRKERGEEVDENILVTAICSIVLIYWHKNLIFTQKDFKLPYDKKKTHSINSWNG
jgi:hypothetical protein